MELLETTGGVNVYRFVCEACGASGDLGLRASVVRFDCPQRCGASYVQYSRPGGTPDLKCVVRPFFAGEEGYDPETEEQTP